MQSKYPSKTWCILPWVHLSTRPDGSIPVRCPFNSCFCTHDMKARKFKI